MSPNVIAALLQRPIAYHPIFKKIGGSTVSGIFLSQAYYWSTDGRISDDRQGWFYKSQQEWEGETGLSRSEQDRARRDLTKAGVLEEVRKGNPARLWFKLNIAKIHTLIHEIAESCNTNKNNSLQNPANKTAESCNQDCRIPQTDLQNPANKTAESCNLSVQRLLTETTSENTSEDAVENPAVNSNSPGGDDENHSALQIDTTQTADQLLANHQPTLNNPVSRQRFEMHWGWEPSPALADHCRVLGVNPALFDTEAQELQLGEFRSYWVSRGGAFNQAGWEHKLASHLQRQQVRLQAPPQDNPSRADRRAAVSGAVMNVNDVDW